MFLSRIGRKTLASVPDFSKVYRTPQFSRWFVSTGYRGIENLRVISTVRDISSTIGIQISSMMVLSRIDRKTLPSVRDFSKLARGPQVFLDRMVDRLPGDRPSSTVRDISSTIGIQISSMMVLSRSDRKTLPSVRDFSKLARGPQVFLDRLG